MDERPIGDLSEAELNGRFGVTRYLNSDGSDYAYAPHVETGNDYDGCFLGWVLGFFCPVPDDEYARNSQLPLN